MFERTDRKPIILGKNTVAFLQIFTKLDDYPDMIFHSESTGHIDYREMAEELVNQFKGHLSLNHAVAFAEAFRRNAENHIKQFNMTTTYEDVKADLDKEWG